MLAATPALADPIVHLSGTGGLLVKENDRRTEELARDAVADLLSASNLSTFDVEALDGLDLNRPRTIVLGQWLGAEDALFENLDLLTSAVHDHGFMSGASHGNALFPPGLLPCWSPLSAPGRDCSLPAPPISPAPRRWRPPAGRTFRRPLPRPNRRRCSSSGAASGGCC